jgi:acetolactate synthase-1/2/3 large subunit
VIVLGGATATVLKGRGALQDIDQLALMRPHVKWAATVARVRDLVPTLERAFVEAVSGVPGRCSSSARSTCCTRPRSSRAGTPRRPKPGKAPSLQERALSAYLDVHTWRMFAGASRVKVGPARVVAPPVPLKAATSRRLPRRCAPRSAR